MVAHRTAVLLSIFLLKNETIRRNNEVCILQRNRIHTIGDEQKIKINTENILYMHIECSEV